MSDEKISTENNTKLKTHVNKQINTTRAYGTQITNEEFNKFLNPFFANIDEDLYTQLFCKKKSAKIFKKIKTKRKKIKYLRKSLYLCFINTEEHYSYDENVDEIADKIISEFMKANLYHINNQIVEEKNFNVLKKQSKINTKRKKLLKKIVDRENMENELLNVIVSLELDIENVYNYYLRNKKRKKGEFEDVNLKIDQINELKKVYKDLVSIRRDLYEPEDVFKECNVGFEPKQDYLS